MLQIKAKIGELRSHLREGEDDLVKALAGISVWSVKNSSNGSSSVITETPIKPLSSLPFGGVKDSGFGRFAGVEGLRACGLIKAVVEDRWWPFIKTKIPKPIQYPIAENAFEFQESLVETLYGLNVWDRLRALVNVLKILTEQNVPANSNKRRNG